MEAGLTKHNFSADSRFIARARNVNTLLTWVPIADSGLTGRVCLVVRQKVACGCARSLFYSLGFGILSTKSSNIFIETAVGYVKCSPERVA
jgi:hypothetical protein